MKSRLKPEVDIVLDVLVAVQAARPNDTFVQSILQQYRERGGLSKKQLEGLHGKASKIETIPQNKLSTLEAIIMRKHTKEKSVLPPVTPLYTKDEAASTIIENILQKYPQHKRVLFFKAKVDNNQPLTPSEATELQKFEKLLSK